MSIRERAKRIAIKPIGPGRILCVPFFTQQMTYWCWAACAAMVLKYYELDFGEQCAIAAKGLGMVNPHVCCNFSTSELCNCRLQEAGITDLWHKTKITGARFIPNQIPDLDLFMEIENGGRPVEIGYGPNADRWGLQHVVIAIGWQGDFDQLSFLVHDPQYQARTAIARFALPGTLNKRRWLETWVQLEKTP